MYDLIIFGNSIFAEIAVYYFQKFSKINIKYIAAEKKYIKHKKFHNIELIDFNQLLNCNKKNFKVFVAIGYSKMNKTRSNFFNEIKTNGFKFENFIHPKANVYSKNLGTNNFIMENVSINPYTKIGNNNIFWSSNIIGHHSVIGNNNFFSGNSTISGNNKIKNNNFFGVNSSTKDSASIDSFCFVDANEYVDVNLKKESFVNSRLNQNNRLKTSQIFI